MNWHTDPESRSFILRRYLPRLAICSLVWEVAQFPLYTLWSDARWERIAFAVVHCTVGDVLIGMPNYSGTHSHQYAASTQRNDGRWRIRDVYIDALPIHFDVPRWLRLFDSNWPRDSEAWISYNERIRNGPHHPLPA